MLTALGLSAVQRLPGVEVSADLEAPAVDLIQHLVRILDEVLEALQEGDREAIGPDVEALSVQGEDALQAGQVLSDIVEELISVAEGPDWGMTGGGRSRTPRRRRAPRCGAGRRHSAC